MNRIINAYGATNTNSTVTVAVDSLVDSIAAIINDIVRTNKLTPEEIICLEHKVAGTVTATCAENILRTALDMRKAERANTINIKTTTVSAKRDLRTPAQWCETFGVEVVDPDGWRNNEPSWNTPITRDMFKARYQASTVRTVDAKKFAPWKNWLEGV